jgi:hypothetical protein
MTVVSSSPTHSEKREPFPTNRAVGPARPSVSIEGSPPARDCGMAATSPGGGDVKGAPVRVRRSPGIGRSGCQVARAVRCARTDYAFDLRHDVGPDVAVGSERCARKWRIEVNEDVPQRPGIILLAGPRGPWLWWVLRGGIAFSGGLLLACKWPRSSWMLPLETVARRRAEASSRQRVGRDRCHCDCGARLNLLGS